MLRLITYTPRRLCYHRR